MLADVNRTVDALLQAELPADVAGQVSTRSLRRAGSRMRGPVGRAARDGDPVKRLRELCDHARHRAQVLEPHDAHDRYANREASYLLQRI